MPILRIALSLLLAIGATFAAAAPAWAHTALKSSDPADGASVSTAPTQVTLTFAEAVTLPAEPISVVGPDGSSWTVGAVATSGATVSAPVQATGPAGRYTLRYTVIADDGDDVKGSVRFTMTTAATPTAATPTTAAGAAAEATATEAAPVAAPTAAPTAVTQPVAAQDTDGSSVWVWVAVAVVVVGVGAALALIRRRRGADR